MPSFGHIHPKVSSASPDWILVSIFIRWTKPGPANPFPISIFAVSVAEV